MNLKIEKNKKRSYSPPQIDRVELDNEISLILQSAPDGPNESLNKVSEYLNNDPFKSIC